MVLRDGDGFKGKYGELIWRIKMWLSTFLLEI